METFRGGPGGQLRDAIDLLEELRDDFTGIVSQAELLHLRHDALQRVFGLGDSGVGKILALLLETLMMLDELFTEKICEAPAPGAGQWTRKINC